MNLGCRLDRSAVLAWSVGAKLASWDLEMQVDQLPLLVQVQLGYKGFRAFDLPPSLARYGLSRDETKWTVERMLGMLPQGVVPDYVQRGL